MNEDLITYKDAADRIGISERSVARLVAKGVLGAVSLTGNGGCMRISLSVVNAYNETLRQKALDFDSCSFVKQ